MDHQILQYLTEPSLYAFYGWWQLVVSLVAFFGLMAIWWHIGKKQEDIGQVFLALSVLCWSFSGAVEIYHANQLQQERSAVFNEVLNKESVPLLKEQFQVSKDTKPQKTLLLNGWRSILSLFNSLFILLALPWFKYIPGRLEAIIKSKYWYYIIGLPFLFSLLPTLSKMILGNASDRIYEPDIYYAILTLFFLGAVLWESFIKRRLTFLAWLTVIVILFTSVAQIFKLAPAGFGPALLSAIFKTSLIMLFFALALSWVKELAQNLIPSPEQLFLAFNRSKNEKGKFENLVTINGLPGKAARKISLTPMLYELFLKFAQRKSSEQDDWLEIKPKSESRTSKSYDIKDHNEIKRLLSAILDGLYGKGNWSKEQHLLPLRQTLFEMSEKRERKVRLRVPSQNISS